MQIEFQNTFEDYKTAVKAHVRSKRWIGNRLRAVISVFALAFAIWGSYKWYVCSQGEQLRNDPVVALLPRMFIATLTGSIGIGWFAQSIQLRRLWRREPRLEVLQRWEISDHIVKIDCGYSRSDVAWMAFSKYLEQPTIFMLYYAKDHFYMVPKRAFAGGGQVVEFRELLRRHVQPQTQGFPVIGPAGGKQTPL